MESHVLLNLVERSIWHGLESSKRRTLIEKLPRLGCRNVFERSVTLTDKLYRRVPFGHYCPLQVVLNNMRKLAECKLAWKQANQHRFLFFLLYIFVCDVTALFRCNWWNGKHLISSLYFELLLWLTSVTDYEQHCKPYQTFSSPNSW